MIPPELHLRVKWNAWQGGHLNFGWITLLISEHPNLNQRVGIPWGSERQGILGSVASQWARARSRAPGVTLLSRCPRQGVSWMLMIQQSICVRDNLTKGEAWHVPRWRHPTEAFGCCPLPARNPSGHMPHPHWPNSVAALEFWNLLKDSTSKTHCCSYFVTCYERNCRTYSLYLAQNT